MNKTRPLSACLLLVLFVCAIASAFDSLTVTGYTLKPGDYTNNIPDSLVGEKNTYIDYPAMNADSTINAYIEIPQGTDAKWETSIETGHLFWELKNSVPRIVKYLGYPGNYGMIPRSLGGDGDPLDIIVLGGMLPRGIVVKTKVIGVMFLTDGGEVDDKLIAVQPGTLLSDASSIKDLDSLYPGVKTILAQWFTNYKGPAGGLEVKGFGNKDTAMVIFNSARKDTSVAITGIPSEPLQMDKNLFVPSCTLKTGDYPNLIPDSLVVADNLFTSTTTKNSNGTINAVIEIPSGTNAKWETSVETGHFFWELKNGSPRVVKYAGYPGDYGMIPQTLGGDGDPLDIIVIGGMALRGTILPVKVIGVLYLEDQGEVDDKLIAVIPGTPLGALNTLSELTTSYPGVDTIIETWFSNYKGPNGGLVSKGCQDVDTANAILDRAIANYTKTAIYGKSNNQTTLNSRLTPLIRMRNKTVEISYTLASDQDKGSIGIFSITGRRIASLPFSNSQGNHFTSFSLKNVASGEYFLSISTSLGASITLIPVY